MRLGDHFILYVKRTPREYRLGIEFQPFHINGFGWRQMILTIWTGSLSLDAIWEWSVRGVGQE
ncbi:MAG: hypothetical protein Q8R92_08510 [Deltaproteobacteria bacterium]|nr:hypothetical protein [Deltaproteobacteria bacterium]